jgi:hypothetical protein
MSLQYGSMSLQYGSMSLQYAGAHRRVKIIS